MRASKFIYAVFVLFLAWTCAIGQSLNTSQVSGTVQDATGAIVSNATIVLTNTSNGFSRTVTSNNSGSYTAPDLPLGPYSVTITAPGFQKYVEKNLVLEVGTNPEVNARLTVGSVNMEVVVEASAGVAVETESNGVGTVINQREVVELPLNGRDPTQLIALAGATTAAPAGDLNSNKNFPTITISVAGGLPNGIAYVLDGGTYNDVFNNLNLPIPFRMPCRSSNLKRALCLLSTVITPPRRSTRLPRAAAISSTATCLNSSAITSSTLQTTSAITLRPAPRCATI